MGEEKCVMTQEVARNEYKQQKEMRANPDTLRLKIKRVTDTRKEYK